MVASISEILDKVSKLKKNEEKVKMLAENDSFALRIVLQGALDPNVEWLLPEGVPPYKPNELVDQQNVLHRDARLIRYFVKGFNDDLSSMKRESMFIEMLEKLDPKDAELLCAIKEKKLPYRGFTVQLVNEALPGLIP